MNKKSKSSSKATKKSLKTKYKVIKNGKVDLEEVKKILADTAIQQKETELQQKKTDRQIEKTGLQQEKTDRQIEKTDRQIEKTARLIEEIGRKMEKNRLQQEETARQMKETDRKMKETDKKINKMVGDFGNQWGQLGENLVSGNLAKRLKEKNIQVDRVITNLSNDHAEFDIIAINGKEIVIVEVKSTLDHADIEKFEKKINNFKSWWPSIAGEKTIYGALAFFMKSNRVVKETAGEKGFFVISATGDVVIENTTGFKPKVFS